MELVFLLGQASDAAEAQRLIAKYRTSNIDAVFAGITQFWDDTLSKIEVKTPDRSMDLLVNRWLLYQTLACRLWARSGFYQSSGAYGFRDQLQDVCALLATRPQIARAHLIRAASRQFAEGDVQHWWLPETGRGVRTRVSDDRVWLAYVAAHYVETTGDRSVLDENVTFIEGPPLREDEHDSFFQPTIAKQSATLFEHCARALDGALTTGSHGLPLMGAGDWNDGMNLVGEGGKGESVWLGWFLYTAITNFAGLAQDRDSARATRWLDHAAKLQKALAEAWDGDWYRRAYFDDGTPLGSVANTECRIDSIAQSWSMISGAGDSQCAARAMAAVEKYLVRRDEGLVLLFMPPFDKATPSPGYIKGYPPGIRENGGQYTHAALWTVLAFAMMGEGDKAYDALSLLNPIHHAGNSAAIHRYRVEPYVACADIYGAPPHVGRGGWTWYTGSAGWMYRVAVESVLGLRLERDTLLVDPCIPRAWPRFDARLRHGASLYEIAVENPNRVGHGVAAADLDGKHIDGRVVRVSLVDDGATHRLRVTLG
jgi:cyclic beta-1,2-glucan synthetase